LFLVRIAPDCVMAPVSGAQVMRQLISLLIYASAKFAALKACMRTAGIGFALGLVSR
jgi:hypothetical protein